MKTGQLTQKHFVAAVVTILGLGLLCGCSTMKPGSMAAVQPQSTEPRAGNVYLLRGFIGFWSAGINQLSDEINAAGVRSAPYQDDQWETLAATIKTRYANDPNAEPLVLIGHSYGADDVVRIARKLNDSNIPVALLVTLDPVTPETVPPNVRVCLNIYQSNWYMNVVPFFRGVPLSPAAGPNDVVLLNADVHHNRSDLNGPGLDHFNIEKQPKIHVEIIKNVLAACPARSVWAQTHRLPAQPLEASAQAANTGTTDSAGSVGSAPSPLAASNVPAESGQNATRTQNSVAALPQPVPAQQTAMHSASH
jgi:pimeloyl-ACP methyl ester carboxylesterase